jgi:hypothetical protein
MGVCYVEKVRRDIENGHRLIFTLWTTTDDASRREDDGEFICNIALFKNQKELKNYGRSFPIKSFNKYHYKRFVDKFCKEIE